MRIQMGDRGEDRERRQAGGVIDPPLHPHSFGRGLLCADPPRGTDIAFLNLFRDIFPAARCVLLICFLSTTNTPQLAAGIFYWRDPLFA